MARSSSTRNQAAFVVSVLAAALVALILPTSPAKGFHETQITAVTAQAYGISLTLPPILPSAVVVPTPVSITNSAVQCPTNTVDTFQGLGVDASPVVFAGASSARVDCPALPAPLPFLLPLAQGDVANATLLGSAGGLAPDVFSASGIHAECSAGPTGPVGAASIATLRILGLIPGDIDLANIPANTVIVIPAMELPPPGVLPVPPLVNVPTIRVVLNEQFTVNGVLNVNAVHITTSDPIFLGIGPIDLILAHAQCSQVLSAIPDVTTTTNGSSTSSSSTSSSSTSSTIVPPTVPPGPFTPLGGVLPGLPPPGAGLAAPQVTLVVPFVPQAVASPTGALARTGSNAWNLVMLAFAAIIVGALLRRTSEQMLPESSEPAPGLRKAISRMGRQRSGERRWS